MATAAYILIIEQTDSCSTSYIVNRRGQVVSTGSESLSITTNAKGWASFDPLEMIYCVRSSVNAALQKKRIKPQSIECVGILQQLYTSVLWDPRSGQPFDYGIPASCSRNDFDTSLFEQSQVGKEVSQLSRLPIVPSTSMQKISWLLSQNPDVKQRLKRKQLVLGTIGSWLLYHLTGKAAFKTDVSSAHYSQLFNPESMSWDSFLMSELGIKEKQLPEIESSKSLYGDIQGFVPLLDGTPVYGMMVPSLSALQALHCRRVGSAVLLCDDLSHLMIRTGDQCPLLTESANPWVLLDNGVPQYGVEAFSLALPSMMSWLDQFNVSNMNDCLAAVSELGFLQGPVVVPEVHKRPFPYTQLSYLYHVLSLDKESSSQSVMTGALQSVLYQIKQRLLQVESDLGFRLKEIHISGSIASRPDMLQFLADLLQLAIVSHKHVHPSVIGLAGLMGVSRGFFTGVSDIYSLNKVSRSYLPNMDPLTSYTHYQRWESCCQLLATHSHSNR